MRQSASMLVCCTLVLAAVACRGDAPTHPATIPNLATPSSNVLSIGDLRRATPQSPCKAPEHRQFDFWVGEWSVTAGGGFAGANIVTSELDGCVVFEHWTGVGQVAGWSLNAYDPSTGLWHQHWIDESGLNLLVSGQLVNGSMVLAGSRFTPAGTVIERLTYTPLAGGGLTQLWDRSFDGGVTFPTIAFNGTYVASPGIQPPPAPGTTSCSGAAYRAADFILGEWRVLAENRLELGRSVITAELSTCVAVERFTTDKGYEAIAFLTYARAPQRWNRTYLDSEGHRVFLTGPAAGDGLALTGEVGLPNGSRVLTRMTWTPTSATSLEQSWEVSHDNGATWTLDERLFYVR